MTITLQSNESHPWGRTMKTKMANAILADKQVDTKNSNVYSAVISMRKKRHFDFTACSLVLASRGAGI